MFRPRVIPVLLLQNDALVKTVEFKNHKYIGDPINAVKIFNDLKADELVFLDIEATKENRLISLDFVRDVGEEANMELLHTRSVSFSIPQFGNTIITVSNYWYI